MIGHFVFCDTPGSDHVTVVLEAGPRESGGRILVPEVIAAQMREVVLPHLLADLSLPSAISYGIFIALKSNVEFRLSGDPSVWREEWGRLILVPN